jgi:sirohydrochlorin cobaltochelatase
MKKIKFMMFAFVAACVAWSFTACGDDDEKIVEREVIKTDTVKVKESDDTNWSRYQKMVNEQVNTKKGKSGNSKVILLVAFGSTWQQAFDTFDKIQEEYDNEYNKQGYDVYMSFSSAICITQAAAGENVENPDQPAEVRLYFDPEHWLTAFGLAGYKEIVVQSLQVIPGEEFRRVRDSYVKDFMNNKNGDFTEDYLHSIDKKVAVGRPLMGEEKDVADLAKVLFAENDVKAALQGNGIVVFMGHGNPADYDYFGANIRYAELEDELEDLAPKQFYVGTVDMPDNLVEDVLDRMAEDQLSGNKVQLYPLMSIAGDHAHNDMADEEDPESWFCMFNAAGFQAKAYETNYPKSEACYKKYQAGTGYIPALAERSAVRKLWMEHTQDAINAIKEGKGMSTPVTEVEEEE